MYKYLITSERHNEDEINNELTSEKKYENGQTIVLDGIVWTVSNRKRIWTEDEIKNLIQTNDRVLYGALKNLYACQTMDEKADKSANHHNGIGFNGVDAPILSSFAQFLEKTGFLTPRQRSLCRKKLIKYNKQLTALANA